MPICDLFKDLSAWKGKRIAVRAEESGTGEGTWLVGDCKEKFVTDGLPWPASIVVGQPAFYSGEDLEPSFGRNTKFDSSSDRLNELRHGRNNVSTIGTFVGTLRVRDQYFATCQDDGRMQGYGYGHLNAAPAELILEATLDLDVIPTKERVNWSSEKCQPPDQSERCNEANTLEDAARIGCIDKTSQLLVKNGIDSHGPKPSPALGVAIRNGHDRLVELLLSGGAPVNPVSNFDYQTPLWQASLNGDVAILRLLIKAGVDVNQKNENGETYLAIFGFSNSAIARELLQAGADPNARDKRGATALMHASAYGNEAVVELLIEYGANINATDENGRTALMYAAEGRREQYYTDAIPHLLANGADIGKRDKAGQTALDIATKLNHTYAVELLKAARR